MKPKILQNLFLTTLLSMPLLACTNTVLEPAEENDWENEVLDSAQYDLPRKELWSKLNTFFKSRFRRIDFNEDEGLMESPWATTRDGPAENRQSYHVAIVGESQPYQLDIYTRQSQRFEKDGQWSEWQEASNKKTEKTFRKNVYEYFNGPLLAVPSDFVDIRTSTKGGNKDV